MSTREMKIHILVRYFDFCFEINEMSWKLGKSLNTIDGQYAKIFYRFKSLKLELSGFHRLKAIQSRAKRTCIFVCLKVSSSDLKVEMNLLLLCLCVNTYFIWQKSAYKVLMRLQS